MIQAPTGSIVALITPMHKGGEIDYLALERLIEFHIKNNSNAIVSVGTTGESATLSTSEHLAILAKTIEFAAGRIPIIAGTGANSTTEAIELTRAAKDLGAHYCLLVTPYYNKPTQEGLYQHYMSIADTVDIPQILYNVPERTAVNLSVETTVRLSEHSNIIGVKDATGDLKIAEQLIRKCPSDFMIYSGDDATALSFIILGGHGGISVTANIVPDKVSNIYKLARSGDIKTARKLDEKIANLHQVLFIESNPIPVKWALYNMGLCEPDIRLPLTPLSKQYQKIIQTSLSTI